MSNLTLPCPPLPLYAALQFVAAIGEFAFVEFSGRRGLTCDLSFSERGRKSDGEICHVGNRFV
jgi:hypothetical protein